MILWETDTVVAITGTQLIKINRSLNDYLHLKEVNAVLQKELAISDSLCLYWRNVSATTDAMYSMEEQKYEQLSMINASLHEAIREEKKRSRKIGIGVGVGGTLLGILLGVLLAK